MRAVRRDALKLLVGVLAVGAAVLMGVQGCGLFESERVSKGRSLYQHYCMHCHGENGRQNEGFNWITMPDPRPRDLSIRNEMETFKDEELYLTLYRDMKDTSEDGGDAIGEDEFAVPTMPTFKYTLSQEDIWATVAFVRSLHGVSLTYDVEGQVQTLQEKVTAAQTKLDEAKKALELAEAKAEAAESENNDEEVAEEEEEEYLEEAMLPEEEALEEAEMEFDEAKQDFERFTKRPRYAQISRPDLTVSGERRQQLAQVGERLYYNKYGCNGCHSVGGQGGIVGPPLDRAGFRLNDTWIYRWIKYPQAMKRKTRMPNLGITDDDAQAITMFLKTLRAPKPDQSIQKVSN